MFFNRTQNNANEQMFNLMVWRDNNGKPGEAIYIQENEMVAYSDQLLGFHTYMLDEPVPVNGVFYIGWQQLTNDNLNLGYDRYNNAQLNTFYNSSGEWFQSSYQGALMMRPLLGKQFEMMGTEEHEMNAGTIVPYPNPLNGRNISFKCTGKYEDTYNTSGLIVTIFNLLGEKVMESGFRTFY